jgi:hypothetical protein
MAQQAGPAAPGYQERLTAPARWWPPALALAAAAATPLGLSLPGAWAVLPYAVLVPGAAAGLWWLGRIRVAVVAGELIVDDARLPGRFVAEVVALDAAGRRELLGASADPLAFVIQRPWVAGAVQVVLDDPADPTPYWLVSSARPERLAEALRSARASGDRPQIGA